MALYNFQPRFVDAILRGEKTHTIREKRKRSTKSGETLHLYTGLRRKGARLLGRVTCSKVESIQIANDGAISIDSVYLSHSEMEQLAKRDGFESAYEMLKFWEGRLPFYGEIIHWRFVPYSPSDVCWCQPFDGPAHPDCPMHGKGQPA